MAGRRRWLAMNCCVVVVAVDDVVVVVVVVVAAAVVVVSWESPAKSFLSPPKTQIEQLAPFWFAPCKPDADTVLSFKFSLLCSRFPFLLLSPRRRPFFVWHPKRGGSEGC